MEVKKFFFSIFILFIFHAATITNSFSQGTWPWAVQANQGPVGAYNESWGLDVATDAAGNMYVAGRFYSDTVYFGAVTLVNGAPSVPVQPSSDIYIVKYDPAGNVIWAKRAGGTGNPYNNNNSYPRSIALDASGNIYMTGAYACATITFGTVTLTNSNTINYSANPWDYFVAKYDASGNVLWAKGAAAGNGGEEGMGVVADASGNVYVSGTFNQVSPSNTITFGSITLNQAGGYFFIVKYDASGNVLWATNPCDAQPEPAGIAIDPSGNNIYIVGTFWGSINFGSTTLTVGGGSNNEGFLVKYNSSGNVVWSKQSVGSWKQQITGVTVDPSGNNVYIVGKYHQSNVITFGSITLPQQGFWDGCIVKYDAASGNALCGQGIGGSGGDEWYSEDVAVHPSGDVYVTGRARGNLTIGSVTLQPTGADPMYVLVFDPNCNAICGDVLASGGNFWNNITIGVSGNVYVAGTFMGTMPVGATTLISAGTSVNWARLTMFAAKYVKCTTSSITVSVTQTNPLCNGQCTGTASANPSGGTAPYTYSWNTAPVQNTATATGLCAGGYVCTVTDATGGITTAPVTITPPAVVTTAITATSASCGNNNGSATVTASGGTGSLTYSWAPSGGNSSAATGLSAGNYTCTVTDANGCTKASSVTVTQTGGPTVATSSTPQTCVQSGSASASASGGTAPYTYIWCNGASASSATGLSAGICTVTVTDAGGCSATSTVTITSSGSIPTAITTATAATCGNSNGTATANVNGGTSPYTYLWNPSGQTTSSATGLSPGSYTIIITDANGCTQTSAAAVAQTGGPTAAVASNVTITPGQTATLTANGGGTYQWSSGSTQNQITVSPSVTTVYCVTVTDAGNCTDSACVTVALEAEPLPCGDIFVPTAFSPDNNGQNEMECVLGGCIQTMAFTIYDRWGEKVFEYSGSPLPSGGAGGGPCWDGTYKGRRMNTATFVYYLRATLTNGELLNKKGNISLIR